MEITQQYLKSILDYNKDTGVFIWKISPMSRIKIGRKAGTINVYGYMQITIRGKTYLSHRLAWFCEYGKWPKNQIDHINHRRTDNRIVNIREACPSINKKNISMYLNNKSGFNGVYRKHGSQKWGARITVKGKNIHLGYFDGKDDAICARLHANRLYKFHANHGK